MKDALKYKKEANYFIESDHYSRAYLYRPEWIWELDKPARAHKPYQVWLDEQLEKNIYVEYHPKSSSRVDSHRGTLDEIIRNMIIDEFHSTDNDLPF